MTHEITLSKNASGKTSGGAIKITTGTKIVSSIKPTKQATTTSSTDDYFKKPVTVALPKTNTPVIMFSNDFPELGNSSMPLFPRIRKYDGTNWPKEGTDIKATTNGKLLYIVCKLHDREPDKAVTKYTKSGGKNAWQDDSVEIFLAKNKKSDFYCQYIVSVSGAGSCLYYKNGARPNQGTSTSLPKGFVLPRINVYKLNSGFTIEMKIALSNIGIKDIEPGDSLLMQVVRNYRGQKETDSVTLHLFPVYIYADKRLGINNHDRRAFQEVKVQAAK